MCVDQQERLKNTTMPVTLAKFKKILKIQNNVENKKELFIIKCLSVHSCEVYVAVLLSSGTRN